MVLFPSTLRIWLKNSLCPRISYEDAQVLSKDFKLASLLKPLFARRSILPPVVVSAGAIDSYTNGPDRGQAQDGLQLANNSGFRNPMPDITITLLAEDINGAGHGTWFCRHEGCHPTGRSWRSAVAHAWSHRSTRMMNRCSIADCQLPPQTSRGGYAFHELRHRCDICNATFHHTNRAKFHKHDVEAHRDILRYPCPICDLSLLNQTERKRHCKTYHREEPQSGSTKPYVTAFFGGRTWQRFTTSASWRPRII